MTREPAPPPGRRAIEHAVLSCADRCPWEYGRPHEGDTATIRWRTLISGDRTATRGITFGVCEVPPGAQLAPHHHGPQEVYYVTAGSAEVLVDGEWRIMRPGDVAYHPSDAVHGIRNRGTETFVLVYAFPTDTFSEIDYVDD